MDLWIRSQDRRSLVKVDNVYISVGNYICYYVEKGKEHPGTYYRPAGELGKYSDERALEVLDEIQRIIKPKLVFTERKLDNDLSDAVLHTHTSPVIKELGAYVYEMPEK